MTDTPSRENDSTDAVRIGLPDRTTPTWEVELLISGVAVFASKAGADTNPAWFHNVIAHPDVTAEIGPETHAFRAHVAEPAEREPIWTRQKAAYPGFADYETKTDRVIPVVVLEPAD